MAVSVIVLACSVMFKIIDFSFRGSCPQFFMHQ